MKRVGAYYLLLIAAWVAAWLAYEAVGLQDRSSSVRFMYWTAAKLLIWVLPVLLIVRFSSRRSIVEYLALENVRRGVRSGLIFGLCFVAVSFAVDVMTKQFRVPTFSTALLNVLVIAPLFEEVVFRGFVLQTLQESGMRFWPSNAVAALMFLGLHVPGWHFGGVLKPSQGITAVGIVAMALVAGYARNRSGSTWSSVVVHFLNNLYSSFAH
jgi:membrane protease YdiL (CAAX protease family)